MRANLVASLLSGICLVLLTALTGNSDAVDARNIQDITAVPAVPALSASNGVDRLDPVVGQSFTFHFPRLHALELRFIVSEDFDPAPDGRLTLHLRDRNEAGAEVATAALPLTALHNNDFSKFVFSPIQDSANRSFYFSLNYRAGDVRRGYVTLWASEGEAYSEGQMALNGVPTDRDLVFRSYYEPDLPILISSLAVLLQRYGWAMLVTLGLFSMGILLVPGRPTGSLAAVGGVSLAVLSAGSLLLLVLHWSAGLILLLLLPLFVIAAMMWVRRVRRIGRGTRGAWLLALLAMMAFGLGLLQIRDTPVPLWVDSVTHARLIQTLIDSGRLPANYFYHLGFHAVTALLMQVTRLTLPTTMLLMGPLLLTQTGLGVFLLCRRLSGSAIAGLTGAICVWFLSPTPAYFTTWGRYPLLLGSALLPLALVMFMEWLDQEKPDMRLGLVAVLLFVGLAFAQVRLVIFYLVFVILYAGLAYRASRRRDVAVRLAGVVSVGLLFAIVWLVLLYARGLTWEALLAENAAAPSISVSGTLAVLTSHHGPELIFLGLGGVFVGILQRRQTVALMLLWYAALYVLAVLPYSSASGALLTPDLVVLMGFLPLAIVIGDSAAWLSAQFAPGAVRKHAVVWGSTALLVVLLGARDNVSIMNPATVQFTDADLTAMAWIREHSAPEATFLANSFNWYGSVYVPVDGGAWIPSLTGRHSDFIEADSVTVVQDLGRLGEWIAARQISYVYIGTKGGLLSRALLACEPERYMLVYRQEGIEIYQVEPVGVRPAPKALPVHCGAVG